MNKKIDLVYLWVDGSDEKWAEKKANALAKLNGTTVSQEAIDDCRFVQNDELKYSLRSVEKYAPWINHIYIVTDNQVPKWLNLNNKKVSIVDHKDIMPKEALPCFNSTVIEHCVVNIPELSENFLYANDDMFFWNDITPDFFFNEKGQNIFRFSTPIRSKKYNGYYGSRIFYSYQLAMEKFGHCVKYFPHHSIDPYNKSDLLEYQRYFSQEFARTMHSHFREKTDIHRSFYAYFMIEEGKAVPVINKHSWFWRSEDGYISLKIKHLKKVLKQKYPILCINDGRKTTDADRRFMKEILEKKFGEKSSFEL